MCDRSLQLQHQMKDTMDTLTSNQPHLLLQQGTYADTALLADGARYWSICADVIEYYVGCETLNTPAEFLERYSSPSHVVLDSGMQFTMEGEGLIDPLFTPPPTPCRAGVASTN